jgi:alkanesulfonate monooxygenase SsuD/methylene tetrahydromethanopterin reductase-like flavin-dependent oxidoreductase (luciferase family)
VTPAPAPRNPGLLGGNPFKLGLFGANCSGGLAFTTVRERWVASWDNNLALAQAADAAGLECLVPVARWKGFGGKTNVNGSALETITWACGLLAATQRINVFGTVHAPMVHPVFAAKQMVTTDHVGHGRFGCNIVCGWNEDEFTMFGLKTHEHEVRYRFAQEWWDIIRRVWSGETGWSFDGAFHQLQAVEAEPRPFGDRAPVMMNAGASPAGRDFAIRNSDLHFDYCRTPAESIARVRETKELACQHGRNIQVWIPASIVCRPSAREVVEFTRHVVDNADWDALDRQYALYTGTYGSRGRSLEETRRHRQHEQERAVLSYGGSYSIRGTPDEVAAQMKVLHEAGFDGVAMGFVNYLDELPFFVQEVLPRMEQLGLRTRALTPP